MDKKKISKKLKKPLKKFKTPLLVVHDPYNKQLADPKVIKLAILEALINSDLDAVRDVLIAHLRTINKAKLSTKTKLGRQTIYDLMNPDKEFNPSLKTLTSILSNLAA